MNINLRNYLMESIGTFFLVLTIGLVIVEPQVKYIAPIIIGFTLSVMIFIGGHISGGHYNPAVTTAMLFQGKLNRVQWLGYIFFQVIGASIAGILAIYLNGTGADTLRMSLGKAFIVEFLYAFLLVFTVLCLSVLPKNTSSLLTGIGVGLVVAIGAFTVGDISGGSFNPAVVIGSLILGVYGIVEVIVLILAIFAGGITATLFFNTIKDTLADFDEMKGIIQSAIMQGLEQAQKRGLLQTQKVDQEIEQEIEQGAEQEKTGDIHERIDSRTKPAGISGIRFADHNRANVLRTLSD